MGLFTTWWSPFTYTWQGNTLENYQVSDPLYGDPLGDLYSGFTGLFLCEEPDGSPCEHNWPPERDDGGGIDWWGVLEQAWDFYNEVIRGDDDEQARERQRQLAQAGAVTSGWFLILVVGAVVGVIWFTREGR